VETDPSTILVDGPGALAATRALRLDDRPRVAVTSRDGWLTDWRASPLNRDLVLLLLGTCAALAAYAALALVLLVAATSRERGRALSALRTLGLDARTGSLLTFAELAPLAVAAVLAGSAIGVVVPWLTSGALGLELATGGFGPPALHVGWWPLGGKLARIGPKRSPVRTPERARQIAAEIEERPGTRLAGVMAYEGHIAGVGDRIPGRPLRSALIRRMQSASERDIRRRLPQIVDAVREVTALEFVNGGGTGSLARTAAAGVVTELTAGSGFYDPVLFDHYRSLALTPAALFVLPIVRRPAPGVVTALGGGYPASGGPGPDRLPQPYLLEGLRLDKQEGAGGCRRRSWGCGEAPAGGDRVTCATPRPAIASASTRCTSWRRPDRRPGADLPGRRQGVPVGTRRISEPTGPRTRSV
jgi:hypothetical protein